MVKINLAVSIECQVIWKARYAKAESVVFPHHRFLFLGVYYFHGIMFLVLIWFQQLTSGCRDHDPGIDHFVCAPDGLANDLELFE
jgi:hypothetical protein